MSNAKHYGPVSSQTSAHLLMTLMSQSLIYCLHLVYSMTQPLVHYDSPLGAPFSTCLFSQTHRYLMTCNYLWISSFQLLRMPKSFSASRLWSIVRPISIIMTYLRTLPLNI